MHLQDIFLVLFVLFCSVTDLTKRKVYNAAVYPAMLSGVVISFIQFGPEGLKISGLGLLAGFLILIIFFLAGGLGAGDVKFLMACGALKGYEFLITGTLYGAIIAGVYSIGYLAYKRKLLRVLKDTFSILFNLIMFRGFSLPLTYSSSGLTLPYVVFLSLGMLLALYFSRQ